MIKSALIVFATPLFTCNIAFADVTDGTYWSYEGRTGPEYWHQLKSEYRECKTGQIQSPVNIDSSSTVKLSLAPMMVRYLRTSAEVKNTGRTIQINLKDGGDVSLPSGNYALKQVHFHTPSEEIVNGKAYPIEAHLVHKNGKGKLAVIALFYQSGKENNSLNGIFAKLPQQKDGDLTTMFDAAQLIQDVSSYYNYVGSLTTPPCTEGVDWYVLKNPNTMSLEQIAKFQKLFPMNARAVQPLNGRVINEAY